MYLTSTAVFVEGDSASPIVILMVVNLIILGAWYFRVRRTRFRLWRTRVGERTAVIRRLPKFVARDSQWRSCCVVALVFIQVRRPLKRVPQQHHTARHRSPLSYAFVRGSDVLTCRRFRCSW